MVFTVLESVHMFTLPTPKIDGISAITITSPDLEASLLFYQTLGFKELYRADMPFPWIQISDGALLMMLRKDNTPYIALTYYVKDIDRLVAALESEGIVFTTRPNAGDMIKRCLIQSPDKMNISLVSWVDGFMKPPGQTMLTTAPQDYAKPEKYTNRICGMFGELAHPVKDLNLSIAFWEKLGFLCLSKMTSPYNWAIVSDGLSIIGLHETDSFMHPAITFFASDMKEKIENLKNKGLTNYTQKGRTNIVIETPEKQNINLFTLGM